MQISFAYIGINFADVCVFLCVEGVNFGNGRKSLDLVQTVKVYGVLYIFNDCYFRSWHRDCVIHYQLR